MSFQIIYTPIEATNIEISAIILEENHQVPKRRTKNLAELTLNMSLAIVYLLIKKEQRTFRCIWWQFLFNIKVKNVFDILLAIIKSTSNAFSCSHVRYCNEILLMILLWHLYLSIICHSASLIIVSLKLIKMLTMGIYWPLGTAKCVL